MNIFAFKKERQRYDPLSNVVPDIVESCISFLENHLKLVGVFRISGELDKVKALKKEFDKGKKPDLSKEDPHTVAGVLKFFFMDLSQPLLTYELYSAWITSCDGDEEMHIFNLRKTSSLLPPLNKCILYRLVKFLKKISEYNEFNLMTVSNLSIVFTPHILREKVEASNISDYMNATRKAGVVTEKLIANADAITMPIWQIPKRMSKVEQHQKHFDEHLRMATVRIATTLLKEELRSNSLSPDEVQNVGEGDIEITHIRIKEKEREEAKNRERLAEEELERIERESGKVFVSLKDDDISSSLDKKERRVTLGLRNRTPINENELITPSITTSSPSTPSAPQIHTTTMGIAALAVAYSSSDPSTRTSYSPSSSGSYSASLSSSGEYSLSEKDKKEKKKKENRKSSSHHHHDDGKRKSSRINQSVGNEQDERKRSSSSSRKSVPPPSSSSSSKSHRSTSDHKKKSKIKKDSIEQNLSPISISTSTSTSTSTNNSPTNSPTTTVPPNIENENDHDETDEQSMEVHQIEYLVVEEGEDEDEDEAKDQEDKTVHQLQQEQQEIHEQEINHEIKEQINTKQQEDQQQQQEDQQQQEEDQQQQEEDQQQQEEDQQQQDQQQQQNQQQDQQQDQQQAQDIQEHQDQEDQKQDREKEQDQQMEATNEGNQRPLSWFLDNNILFDGKIEISDEDVEGIADKDLLEQVANLLLTGRVGDLRKIIRTYNQDGSSYEGELDEFGNYHGMGKFTFSDGSVYEGEYSNGKRHGKGKLSYSNGSTYVGEFAFNDRHGEGVFTDKDGNVYSGSYKYDVRHGYGMFKFKNSRYEGEFKYGKPNGQGSFYFSNGNKYEGNFVDNIMHGYGIFNDVSTNCRYEGEHYNGKRHGKGKFFNANGNIFEGEFVENEMHYGTYKFANGACYVGELKDGKFNGKGTYTFPSGKQKTGTFVNGKPVD